MLISTSPSSRQTYQAKPAAPASMATSERIRVAIPFMRLRRRRPSAGLAGCPCPASPVGPSPRPRQGRLPGAHRHDTAPPTHRGAARDRALAGPATARDRLRRRQAPGLGRRRGCVAHRAGPRLCPARACARQRARRAAGGRARRGAAVRVRSVRPRPVLQQPASRAARASVAGRGRGSRASWSQEASFWWSSRCRRANISRCCSRSTTRPRFAARRSVRCMRRARWACGWRSRHSMPAGWWSHPGRSLRERFLAVDPARAEALARARPEVERRFATLGEPVGWRPSLHSADAAEPAAARVARLLIDAYSACRRWRRSLLWHARHG